ncbi:cupin domain-containing protein [Plasticicumulans sp.]|uniref:cupin domain-containing protein n=1 Tax=Plasticicumulans sp. TaxID=2307179 RepID=UPI002B92AAFC|nr:cupin domain-containing protein [Plasticicumulans sp.]HNM43114.1 cupin domain-containing protein [Plasticicumulans sp.]
MTQDSNQPLPLLGGLTVRQFLRDYWQQKPLLVRKAIPGFKSPISPEELAGLACDEEVVSRLVMERGGRTPWELRRGPFTEEDFLELPETHWTLLVSDVEKQAPDMAGLIEPFRFVPDWRIDDLMISYAPEHGTVGPHVDDYDVFLLQGLGRRRWQISTQPVDPDNFLPDVELRILDEFEAEQEWVLEPGDLLYLPPKVAHHGIALGPCMTYSIGFRAPLHSDMIGRYVDFLMEEADHELRYRDEGLAPQDNPGRIGADALDRIKDLIRSSLATGDDLIESWFGRYITEPKPGYVAEPEDDPYTLAELRRHLKDGGQLERNPGSRFAYIDHGQDSVTLFVDGQEFALGPALATLARVLCRERILDSRRLQAALSGDDAWALLLDLLNEGFLVIYEG